MQNGDQRWPAKPRSESSRLLLTEEADGEVTPSQCQSNPGRGSTALVPLPVPMPGQVYHRQKRSPSRIQSTPPLGQRRWLRSGEGQELAQRHSRGDSGSEASEVNQDDLLNVLDESTSSSTGGEMSFLAFLCFSASLSFVNNPACINSALPQKRREGRKEKDEAGRRKERRNRDPEGTPDKRNIIHLCTKGILTA